MQTLPSLDQFRKLNTFVTNKTNIHIRSLKAKNIDVDIYLGSIGENLQRAYVWTKEQASNLIKSIILGMPIPPITLVAYAKDNCEDAYLLLDGKQRYTSIMDFINDKTAVEINGIDYKISQLPDEYRTAINTYALQTNIIEIPYGEYPNDATLITWFKKANPHATPLDINHIHNLETKITTNQ